MTLTMNPNPIAHLATAGAVEGPSVEPSAGVISMEFKFLRGTRAFHRNVSGRMSGTTAAGVLMAVVGAVLAVVALFGVLFLPTATFPVIDAEILGIAGLLVAIFGAVIAALDK